MIFVHTFLINLGGSFDEGGHFSSSQASGWSILMISISKCRSKQRLLIHMSWELGRIEHDRVRETDYFILLYNLFYKY